MKKRRNAYLRENHPEMKEGEVFLTNASDERHYLDDSRSSWECVGWKTKRRGVVAYDINGNAISGMSPVFVQRAELESAGIDPDKIWDNA